MSTSQNRYAGLAKVSGNWEMAIDAEFSAVWNGISMV